MTRQIIVDSCCDLTPKMREKMGITSIPLTMTVGNNEFLDDENLDIDGFINALGNCSDKPSSASPPPFLFQEAVESADESYITLSERLSGSYGNAVIGNNMAIENGSSGAYIFDSKSATAGETLIAIKLYELIESGKSREEIIETVNNFINDMKTYCALENYDNLQKNGRLSKITSSIIQVLNIRLIMGANGNGEFALFEKCRGVKHMTQRILNLIMKSGKETKNESLVITHCNNLSLAIQLKDMIVERFNFKKIYVVPTGGLSSLYTDNKGVTVAF